MGSSNMHTSIQPAKKYVFEISSGKDNFGSVSNHSAHCTSHSNFLINSLIWFTPFFSFFFFLITFEHHYLESFLLTS